MPPIVVDVLLSAARGNKDLVVIKLLRLHPSKVLQKRDSMTQNSLRERLCPPLPSELSSVLTLHSLVRDLQVRLMVLYTFLLLLRVAPILSRTLFLLETRSWSVSEVLTPTLAESHFL